MGVHNQRPTLGSEDNQIQSKSTLNNLIANSCNYVLCMQMLTILLTKGVNC